MEYPEFSKYKFHQDKSSLCNAYEDEFGNLFYVEPGFYTGLKGFEEKRRDFYSDILEAIDAAIKKNHKVIFTGDFESPFLLRDGFVYLEIQDITDPLGIFVEDKSRGSDYGD